MDKITETRAEYKARLKQRQTVIFGSIGAVMAILLALNMLFFTGILPFPFYRGFSSAKPVQYTVPCAAKKARPVPLGEINVRVYNATARTGIAQQVSDVLKERGVNVSATANWDSKERVTDSALIITGRKTVSQAYTLRAFFPKSRVVFEKGANTGIVDVVIGKQWKEMYELPAKADFRKAMNSLPGCTPDF